MSREREVILVQILSMFKMMTYAGLKVHMIITHMRTVLKK